MLRTEPPRRGRGRPRKPPGAAAQRAQLNISLTPEEADMVRDAAELDSRPTSAWARDAAVHAARQRLRAAATNE